MFTLLKERYLQDRENKLHETIFYIENGYCESWNEEHKTTGDNGIERYCTETRWNQYISGKITREKIVELTVKRYEKQLAKEIEKQLLHLDMVAAAKDLEFMNISIVWKKSSCYGSHPTATVYTNTGTTTGYAGGWGYDKESAAVAEAFNNNLSILKELYKLKENALAAGKSDYSRTACTGVDNRNACGYGSGYTVIPYFEGGVGVGCFWNILEKCGYKVRCNYGKHETFYNVYKGV